MSKNVHQFFKSVHESLRPFKKIQKRSRTVYECSRACKDVQKRATISKNVEEYSRAFENLENFINFLHLLSSYSLFLSDFHLWARNLSWKITIPFSLSFRRDEKAPASRVRVNDKLCNSERRRAGRPLHSLFPGHIPIQCISRGSTSPHLGRPYVTISLVS